jgi:hypothetical protein
MNRLRAITTRRTSMLESLMPRSPSGFAHANQADPARVSHGMFAPSATRPSRAWFDGLLLGLYVHASPSFG